MLKAFFLHSLAAFMLLNNKVFRLILITLFSYKNHENFAQPEIVLIFLLFNDKNFGPRSYKIVLIRKRVVI